MADLKAYRRARGLFDHCDEKWSRDHKRAVKVGFNVLDEQYALFTEEHPEDGSTPDEEESGNDAQYCYLSGVPSASSRSKTLQF